MKNDNAVDSLRSGIRRAVLVALLAILVVPVSANEPIGSVYRDYVRVLALLGRSTWTPRSFNTYSDGVRLAETVAADHLWSDRFPRTPASAHGIHLLDPEMRLSGNTHLPFNRNNQAQWEGRGLNTWLSAGLGFQWGDFRGALAPEFWFAQNLRFDTLPSHSSIESEWGDYFAGIDRPQRFGDDPVVAFGLGQTGVRFERWNLGVALTTENMWLGPAMDNAIVMSNNAAGFPRFEIGTAEPAQTRFGRFEAVTWWGRLTESDFFDSNPDNDHTFHLGYSLGYVPPVLDNLYLGFNRSYLSPWSTIDTFKVFQHFDTFFKNNRRTFNGGEDDIHQVASLTAHWFLPAAGFEVFLEWARNDHTSNFNDFLRNPEHSQAFTFGFRKAYDLQQMYLVLEGEITKLGNNETTTLGSPRPTFPYYRHGAVAQGYTNRGQIMGAWIGTGSNSQYLGVKGYFPWGIAHAGVQRVAWDQDYYLQFQSALGDRTFAGYQVSVLYSAGATVFVAPFDLGIDYSLQQTLNRNWQDTNTFNNTVMLSARYRF